MAENGGGVGRPRAVLGQFLRFPALVRTVELDEHRCLATLAAGIQAELIVVGPGDFVATLFERTGASDHIAKLRAISRSQLIPDFVEVKSKAQLRFDHENEIYRRLGLQYVPPELREDEGEIEAAGVDALPQLVELENIRGIIHCHTIYSDGRNSIEELALAAQAMGMSYLTITDHSPTAHYAGGVAIDRRFKHFRPARFLDPFKFREKVDWFGRVGFGIHVASPSFAIPAVYVQEDTSR